MAKIAIIGDTHFGIRNDNQLIYKDQEKFYSKVFFPYIDEHKIDTVIHLGDVVDRRKYINYLTNSKLHDILMQPLFERDLDVHFLVGNHDIYYKDTNSLNAISELYGKSAYKFHLYEEPEEVNIHGLDIVMLPWIYDGALQSSIDFINNARATVLMGHLGLAGFEFDKGHVAEHGLDKKYFDKFDAVYSGHYHHKSSVGNIHYLGSPNQFTWTDFDDDKGFHVLDTETREIEFIRNPYELFKKFIYNDQGKTSEEVLNFDPSIYVDTYTKIVVKNKTDPYLFDRVLTKIEDAGVHDLKIVEDHLNLDVLDDEDIIDEAQDTLTILKKFIYSLETDIDKGRVDKFLHDLYTEAMNIE